MTAIGVSRGDLTKTSCDVLVNAANSGLLGGGGVDGAGPMHWEHVGGGADLLADCHRNALAIADQLGATSIAFPAISCGVYGWSATDAAPIALTAVREYFDAHPQSQISKVHFVLFNDEALEAFEAALLLALGRYRSSGSNSGFGV